jgi:hypothetical protein
LRLAGWRKRARDVKRVEPPSEFTPAEKTKGLEEKPRAELGETRNSIETKGAWNRDGRVSLPARSRNVTVRRHLEMSGCYRDAHDIIHRLPPRLRNAILRDELNWKSVQRE